MRRVFCLTKDGMPFTSNVFYAWEGFNLRGYDVRKFESKAELDTLNLTKDDIVVAGIPIVQRAFDILGVTKPNLPDIPEELVSFAGRAIRYGTLEEIHDQDMNVQPCFIKPHLNQKLFVGHVVTKFRDLIQTSSYPRDTPIQISEVVDFISEYRGFVLNRKLVGLKHYNGTFAVVPDCNIINAAIEAYTDQPAAYSIDFGVTSDGRSLLIEINDAYALGNYGLHSSTYTAIIEARWDEIVGN